tara:strand:+ start:381 stop:629 length:249 start_codon:yes stop_codon:yes gene_type:complete
LLNDLIRFFAAAFGDDKDGYKPKMGFVLVCFIGSLLYLVARCVTMRKINKMAGCCCKPKSREISARSDAVKAIVINLAVEVV